tara:strand:- start:83 stop:379 length:297 start_codon:yes stop_codon:yes gene_type:complete
MLLFFFSLNKLFSANLVNPNKTYNFVDKLITMENFLSLFLISLGLMVFVFAGIGIKILLKKNGEFSGTCASQNPFLNKEGEACGFCGAEPDEKCKKED